MPTDSSNSLRGCSAPAKLNLFLHITGRRPDGYHSLQTVFQLLDWGDTLHFTRRDDGAVTHLTPVRGVPAENDLSVRAARLLQAHTGCRLGVDIEIDKQLPMGAGLGGGSSDAATTLLALNRLWHLDLSRAALQVLALRLGADVPFFVFGRNAFAQGVGEALEPVELPARCFLVVTPAVQVPTTQIFRAQELTRDSKLVKITDFLERRNCAAGWPDSFGRNDMQPVVAGKYNEVARVLQWFDEWFDNARARCGDARGPHALQAKPLAPARMTGSGASVFAAFPSRVEALAAQAALPSGWSSAVASSLQKHPLLAFAA